MKSLNVLVTGASGQLGKSIKNAVKKNRDKYFYTDVDSLDITDEKAVRNFVEDNNIDIIINCAAFTNVDAAEDNRELAELLNGKAPAILARSISKKGGTLIHISTDYVFGGSGMNTPIKETATPYPTGIYGETKLHGEEEIKKTGAKYIILRTAWLYSDYGNNFIVKIFSLLENRNSIQVVFDQCGTPTYANDLAEAIINIISERKFSGNEGIYHFSNEGVCSWYDFALEAVRFSNMKDKEVRPCLSNEFPSKVIRPAYSVLDKTKFKETFDYKIPYWRESLENMLSKAREKH